MRIIAGALKNRELKTPKSEKTRPTAAKVRKSLFDILQSEIEGANFLDLFAGSGAMGIEALSRGAKNATFVEKDRGAAKALRSNLKNFSLTEKSILLQTDATLAVKQLVDKESRFDLIYIDPPYTLSITPLLEMLHNLLMPTGILIIEQRKGSELVPSELTITKKKEYGDTVLLFFSPTNDRAK